MDGVTDLLNRVLDAGTKIGNRFLDFEFAEMELNLINQARANEAAYNAAQQPASFSLPGANNTALLIGGVAVAGVVLILLLRK